MNNFDIHFAFVEEGRYICVVRLLEMAVIWRDKKGEKKWHVVDENGKIIFSHSLLEHAFDFCIGKFQVN